MYIVSISIQGSKFIALADYTAMGHSEVSMREGEAIELLKVGCAGWWYVRVLGNWSLNGACFTNCMFSLNIHIYIAIYVDIDILLIIKI